MIETKIYPVAELPPLLECQIRDFVRIVWPTSNVDNPAIPLGPQDRDPVHIVIVDGTMLISHVQILTFSIEHAGETYRLCGVSGVFSYPNFRSGGYGKQVVSAASEYIASRDVDLGMLFTMPSLEPFYARAGWIALPDLKILAGDKNKPEERDQFTMLYPVTEKGKLAVTGFENASV